jgi:large subunit ribosomal protein L3
MPGLIGKKIGMTSVFDEEGKTIPCTVIEVGPCVVTQIKTEETDGYRGVQLAFDEKKEKHTSKAMIGHFKKAKTTPKRKIVELKGFVKDWKPGDVITVDYFNDDTWLDVPALQKVKDFRGSLKDIISRVWACRLMDSITGRELPDQLEHHPILQGY